MKKPVRIGILGGGYVAIFATRALKKAIKRGEVEVTVISRENYHVFHGYVSEMITGRIGPGQILSPVRRIFAPARVHVGEIESIDLINKRVVTSQQLDGRRYEHEFDHIVLCLGTVDNLDSYPGLAEHAFKLKTYDDCFSLKNHILKMFELASIEENPEERKKLLTFFIAGGGYAGTELAGELGDYMRLLTSKEYKHIKREECRVVLVHPGKTILPELYSGKGAAGYGDGKPKLVEYATHHMHRLGVELKTNTRVTWATPNEVGLSNGERIATRTIVSAVGTRPSPILDTLPIERNERGRVTVDSTFRLIGYDDIWSAGDCAAVPHINGGTCPPVGIFAMIQGRELAKNILRSITAKKLKPFTYRGLGQAVSIGKRTAVGEMKGIPFKGLVCWLMWRAMSFYYFPTWDRRLRLFADWLIWPMVGRDIVEMSVNDEDDYEISHHVFQPGELILEQGQYGKYMYVITDGEVELLKEEEGMETSIGTIGVNQYFGHIHRNRKLEESIRALTVVHAVSIRNDQAKGLKSILSALEKVAAE